jgi:hypothetical protein
VPSTGDESTHEIVGLAGWQLELAETAVDSSEEIANVKLGWSAGLAVAA